MQKKSILFIADKPDWAYHNIIKTWSESLQNDFDCYVAFSTDFEINIKKFTNHERLFFNTANKLLKKDLFFKIDSSKNFSCPIYQNPPVYKVLNLKKVNKIHFDISIEMAYYFQYTAHLPFNSDKKLIGIYTDSFPHEGPSYDHKKEIELKNLNREEFHEQYLKKYDGIIVGNTNLYSDYNHFTDKIIFANGIYKQNEFLENNNIGENDTLTIGWTGNPNRPMKGFKEVIIPAIEEVEKTGRKIKLKTQFSGSYDSILSFYKDVDLVVIASEADTGPSLFSDACLSDVPSVSTKIGFPKMVIQHEKNGLFVNRDIDEVKNAIIKLYDDRILLKKFSKTIKQDYLKLLDNQISINNLKNYINTL